MWDLGYTPLVVGDANESLSATLGFFATVTTVTVLPPAPAPAFAPGLLVLALATTEVWAAGGPRSASPWMDFRVPPTGGPRIAVTALPPTTGLDVESGFEAWFLASGFGAWFCAGFEACGEILLSPPPLGFRV